jgi:hypothetical protein
VTENISGEDFPTSGLKGFYDEIRLFREILQGTQDPDARAVKSFLKDYLELGVVLAAHLDLPGVAGKLCLLLYRIPSEYDLKGGGTYADEGWRTHSAEIAAYVDSNIVLAVRERSHPSDPIITSGIGIRSRVWLMRPDCVPEPLINPAPFKNTLEIAWAGGPGIVGVGVDMSAVRMDKADGGKHSLIEGVAQAGNCFGSLSGRGARQSAIESKLVDHLAGIRIKLGEKGSVVWDKECFTDGVEFCKCVFCPTDTLFSREKRTGYMLDIAF